MKSIFNKNKVSKNHSLLIIIISIILIISDSYLQYFSKFKVYIEIIKSPFYFLKNDLKNISNDISLSFTKNASLKSENKILKKKLLLKNSQLLLLNYYKDENIKLKNLLVSAPLLPKEKIVVTQVLSTKLYPYTSKITIDKGLSDEVYVGQPVVNENGVIGQVISSNNLTSEVLLICDNKHAIPVQVLRNNIRIIIKGNGYRKELKSEILLNDIDIKIGDLLVTSYLGGRFPAGYPVAIVSSVKIDNKSSNTIISANPINNFQHLHYLLLLWDIEKDNKNLPLLPEVVKEMAKERMHILSNFSFNDKN